MSLQPIRLWAAVGEASVPLQLQAEVRGDWAVHREVLGWTPTRGLRLGRRWVVSHAPSGFTFFPEGLTRPQALAKQTQLQGAPAWAPPRTTTCRVPPEGWLKKLRAYLRAATAAA